jgi:hypothetical protein
MFVLYIYLPVVSPDELRKLFVTLESLRYRITHLGKKDPPKKWNGSVENAIPEILSGTDLTISTYLRDATARLSISIDIHRDTRWTHSTISCSLPDEAALIAIGNVLARGVRCFAVIQGKSGGGKNQKWNLLSISDDCPESLKEQIK